MGPAQLARLLIETVTPLPTVMSAALPFTFPAVVFFLLFQRHIVAGLTAGAIKG